MGILYNRFTPEAPLSPSLIPYSVQSNIYTYLEPASFKGSSSTVWGDDFPVPMDRDQTMTEWQYNSDGSVHLKGSSFTIRPSRWGVEDITTYTVYMVVRYNDDGSYVGSTRPYPYFELIRGQTDNTLIYEGYEAQARAQLIGTNATYTSTLSPVGSLYERYHVYAFRHCHGKYCHVIDDGNLVAINAPTYLNRATYNFTFRYLYNSEYLQIDYSADVKFLSIVKGEESDTTILNNVYNIMTQLII